MIEYLSNRGLCMSDQPTVTDYQAKDRLEQYRDLMRVAFGEQSGRNDQRGAQANLRDDIRRKQAEQNLQNFQFQLRVSDFYKALYADVMNQIEDIQAKICAAIIDMQGRLQTAQAELDALLERANKLPDGTPVFQYEDGIVKTDTGRVLDEQERASLVWREDIPKVEALDRARDKVDDINNGLLLLQGYDAEVQGLADQAAALENTDTPKSRLVLQDISQKAQVLEKSVETLLVGQRFIQTKPKDTDIPAIIPDYSQ